MKTGSSPGYCYNRSWGSVLGYREVTTLAETLFGPAGTTLRGHEFHWSDMEMSDPHAWLYFFPIPRPSNTGSKWFRCFNV